MILKVKDNEKFYEISIEQLSQWCGTNIPQKRFIINSLTKYFSSSKYMEYEERYIENILIDGEQVGRKYFKIDLFAQREELISAIKIGKSSLMWQCISHTLNGFQCQYEMEAIENSLIQIFQELNAKILNRFGLIELEFEQEQIFDMVQKTQVRALDGKYLEELSNCELIMCFLELFDYFQKLMPQKRMIIFENIDHLISPREYVLIYEKCENIIKASDSWFIFSLSLQEYPVLNDKNLESVSVINDAEYILPDYEHLAEYLQSHYPYNHQMDSETILSSLKSIVHKIGNETEIESIESQVILKLMNNSLCIKNKMRKVPKNAEINFLMD